AAHQCRQWSGRHFSLPTVQIVQVARGRACERGPRRTQRGTAAGESLTARVRREIATHYAATSVAQGALVSASSPVFLANSAGVERAPPAMLRPASSQAFQDSPTTAG